MSNDFSFETMMGQIPHKYNPNAPVSEKVDKFIRWVCEGDTNKEFNLLSVLARCMIPNNWYGQCVYIFTGEGRQYLVDFITDLVGRDNRCDFPIEELRIGTNKEKYKCILSKLINVNENYPYGYIMYDPLKAIASVGGVHVMVRKENYRSYQISRKCKTILCMPTLPMQLSDVYYNVFKLLHHVYVPKRDDAHSLWSDWTEDDWSDLINRASRTLDEPWTWNVADELNGGKEYFTEWFLDGGINGYKSKKQMYAEYLEYSDKQALTPVPHAVFKRCAEFLEYRGVKRHNVFIEKD